MGAVLAAGADTLGALLGAAAFGALPPELRGAVALAGVLGALLGAVAREALPLGARCGTARWVVVLGALLGAALWPLGLGTVLVTPRGVPEFPAFGAVTLEGVALPEALPPETPAEGLARGVAVGRAAGSRVDPLRLVTGVRDTAPRLVLGVLAEAVPLVPPVTLSDGRRAEGWDTLPAAPTLALSGRAALAAAAPGLDWGRAVGWRTAPDGLLLPALGWGLATRPVLVWGVATGATPDLGLAERVPVLATALPGDSLKVVVL